MAKNPEDVEFEELLDDLRDNHELRIISVPGPVKGTVRHAAQCQCGKDFYWENQKAEHLRHLFHVSFLAGKFFGELI